MCRKGCILVETLHVLLLNMVKCEVCISGKGDTELVLSCFGGHEEYDLSRRWKSYRLML